MVWWCGGSEGVPYRMAVAARERQGPPGASADADSMAAYRPIVPYRSVHTKPTTHKAASFAQSIFQSRFHDPVMSHPNRLALRSHYGRRISGIRLHLQDGVRRRHCHGVFVFQDEDPVA